MDGETLSGAEERSSERMCDTRLTMKGEYSASPLVRIFRKGLAGSTPPLRLWKYDARSASSHHTTTTILHTHKRREKERQTDGRESLLRLIVTACANATITTTTAAVYLM